MGGNRTRKMGHREKTCILIYTQGEKTEPIYFRSFKKRGSAFTIKIIPHPVDPKELVCYAVRDRKQAKHGCVLDVWCVFDKDDTSDSNFNEAIEAAHKNRVRVAYSIECFELWLLLHYEDVTNPLTRDKYNERLSCCLGEKYDKTDDKQISGFRELQSDAIGRAKKLYEKMMRGKNYAAHNPISNVFELVEYLEEIA